MGKITCKVAWLALTTLGLFLTTAHAGENLPAFEQYVSELGTTYCETPEIGFHEIGDSAPKNAERLWPFDLEEAKKKYATSVAEIIGTVFTPVSCNSGHPLVVSMSVSILNENDALSAQIQVKVYKETGYYFTPDGQEPVLLSSVPQIFWERTYLYIDADYLADANSPDYAFRETIDKYFKEFLFEFVQHTLYSYKILRQIPADTEKDTPSSFDELRYIPDSI